MTFEGILHFLGVNDNLQLQTHKYKSDSILYFKIIVKYGKLIIV